MSWHKAMAVEALRVGDAKVVKAQGKQVAVFRVSDGAVHAVDNRCPHEGYPLATGALKDGVLTCEWHNWKFRLCDGACVLGGEDVRSYPLKIEDGHIFIDLRDPDRAAHVPAYGRSLETAFDEEDWGQMSRAAHRLLQAGETPAQVLARGCAWSAPRAKYGFDHGLAAAADYAAAFDAFPGEEDVPLLQALQLLAEPQARRKAREAAAPEPVRGELAAAGDELRRRIEDEDRDGAEALVRGAVAAGAAPETVFRWLTGAATDHFLGFGHSHIYVAKAEELLARIGWRHADVVLPSLVSSIVLETREDRLPYMRAFNAAMAPHTERLAAWAARPADPGAALGVDGLIADVVDGDLDSALAAVAGRLERGVAPERIAAALGVAAAERILRFDAALEHRLDVDGNWLLVTHGLTHADAVLQSVRRYPGADALRGLFHSARFIQHTRPLDGARGEIPPHPTRSLADALQAGDAGAAMAAVRHGGVTDRELHRASVSDRATLPIFVAHHVKTAFAATRVAAAAGSDLPRVAVARFLAHPLAERRMTYRAHIARDFVREGRLHTKQLGY